MKKYLSFILFVLLIFSMSCTKNKSGDENKEEEFKILEFDAKHEYDLLDNNIYSYMIVKGKPTENGFNQSLTFYSFIIKNNIVGRDYEYFQVDYYKNDKKETYYHIFDAQDDYSGLYAQNFMPYIVSEKITSFKALVKYSYHLKDTNELVNKEVTYKEDVITFDKNKDFSLDKPVGFNLLFYETDNSTDLINSYKLMLNFDDKVYIDGHFDFQVFLEIDDEVLPFYGVYNYPVVCGSFLTISDEKIDKKYNIKSIYWDIIHYTKNGNKTEVLYKENLL